MRHVGYSRDDIEKYLSDTTSSDYNNLLAVSFDMVDEINSRFSDNKYFEIREGRRECDFCGTICDSVDWQTDGDLMFCSENCAKVYQEAHCLDVDEVHMQPFTCDNCKTEYYGCWWTDCHSNTYCSKQCAINYNLNTDNKTEEDND